MVRVLTSQWEFTRLSSIKFSCSLVRDVVPTVINQFPYFIGNLTERDNVRKAADSQSKTDSKCEFQKKVALFSQAHFHLSHLRSFS